VSGTVVRVNQQLTDHPEWVNEDCWDKAWMIVLRPDEPIKSSDDLLDAAKYAEHLEQAG
jgi:glycine cleavage system H protein